MSLIIGEMQTKTMRYNFVPLWVSTVQKKEKKKKKERERRQQVLVRIKTPIVYF